MHGPPGRNWGHRTAGEARRAWDLARTRTPKPVGPWPGAGTPPDCTFCPTAQHMLGAWPQSLGQLCAHLRTSPRDVWHRPLWPVSRTQSLAPGPAPPLLLVLPPPRPSPGLRGTAHAGSPSYTAGEHAAPPPRPLCPPLLLSVLCPVLAGPQFPWHSRWGPVATLFSKTELVQPGPQTSRAPAPSRRGRARHLVFRESSSRARGLTPTAGGACAGRWPGRGSINHSVPNPGLCRGLTEEPVQVARDWGLGGEGDGPWAADAPGRL